MRSVPAVMMLAFASAAFGAGGLTWTETEQILRPLPSAKSATTEFRFVNSRSEPVGIVAVRASCDCITAKASKVTHAPGEAGAIRVEFSGAPSEGRVERTITVTTTDAPDHPTMLKVIVEAPEAVAMSSRGLVWRLGEAPLEKEVELVVADSERGAIHDVQCTEPAFAARLKATEAMAGRYRVTVKPTDTGKIAQAVIRLKAVIGGEPRVLLLTATVK